MTWEWILFFVVMLIVVYIIAYNAVIIHYFRIADRRQEFLEGE